MISLAFNRLLFLTILLSNTTYLKSQPKNKNTTVSTTFLDSILQQTAYKSFSHYRSKTGIIYNSNVTQEFTGITVSAIRLRTGSLRRKGYYGYKEFDIPSGVFINPYVERVVLAVADPLRPEGGHVPTVQSSGKANFH